MLAVLISRMNESKVIDQAEVTGKNLADASAQIEVLVKEISGEVRGLDLNGKTGKTFNRADSVLISAQNAVNKLGGNTDQVLFTLRETLEEIRSTNRSMKRAIQKISDNPGRSFLSEPPPVEK
jgi:hypothetical protein